MEIREMVKEDLIFFNEVRNNSVGFLHDNTKYSLKDNLKWFIGTNPKFFIVEDNGEPIGYFRTSKWVENTLYVGMDIHPKYRGIGYAKKSYNLFFKYLKKEYSVEEVFLEVLNTNKRAIHIYNKLGFTIIDLLPHNNKELSIKMKLKL
tara:strand:- start:9765 stop:10208 length:444 start_codon:yes stop_codon:yes gene_type:complete